MEGPRLIGLLVGLGILGLVFTLLEGVFRSTPAPPWFRRADVRTDLGYWFFTPLVSRALTRIAVAGALVAVVWLSGGSLEALRADFRAGRTPDLGWPALAGGLRALPFAAQLLLGLFVADGISYWLHRAFHRRPLWSLHAVHHSSPRLDWLSALRLHPLNQAGMRILQSLPLLFLGFDPTVFATVAPVLSLYAIGIHANVGWSFGPLRYVVASPRFHRWHHTSQAEGRDRNFAGLFPLWDLVFGTFYMPARARPTRFGAGDEPVPAGLWSQVLYPLRRARRDGRLAAEVV